MDVEASWEAEYRRGRYSGEPPVPFTEDILAAARASGLSRGLYVGCGNGRNFIPLSRAGLDLTGLDLSATALEQLADRAPEYTARLIHGDLRTVPAEPSFDLVIGIQVFQHGDRDTVHAALARAQGILRPGGLFCLRVNAVGTDVWPAYELTEQAADGGFTIRYLAGSKTGLLIHYFSEPELGALFPAPRFEPVLPPRIVQMPREPTGPSAGQGSQWSQWEAIWRLGPGMI